MVVCISLKLHKHY